MASTENGFIKSNVDFTTASGWLERLVRPLKFYGLTLLPVSIPK